MKRPSPLQYLKAWFFACLLAPMGIAVVTVVVRIFLAGFFATFGPGTVNALGVSLLPLFCIILAVPTSYFAFRWAVDEYLLPSDGNEADEEV